MKRLLVFVTPLLILVLVWGTIGCEKKATPTPAPTATATTIPTTIPTATPTRTLAPTPTAGPTSTATLPLTATPTRTATPTPTGAVTLTPTPTPRPTPTPTPAGKPEGELRLAVPTLFGQQWDALTSSSYTGKSIWSVMYDVLVGATDDGALSTETGLAKKWEHSADYLSWTFYLREGVKFHNGDDLTAEDVKFNLQRFSDPKALGSYAKALFGNFKEIVVDGPYQVTVKLKSPEFFLEYKFSSAESGKEAFILPKKYIEANGMDYFQRLPVGSGPYRLVESVAGSSVKLEALDYHWSLGVPKYKSITLYEAPEEITRIAMLKGGQVDVIDIGRASLPGLQKDGYSIFTSRLDTVIDLRFCSFVGRSNPGSDPKVREALWLAINKQAILDYLFGGQGELEGQRYPYPYVLGSENLPPKPYDPERAKQLLKEAGYPERFSPTLSIQSYVRPGFPEGPAMLEAIAADWIKVGVQVRIVPMDLPTYAAKHFARAIVNGVSVGAFPPSKLAMLGQQGGRSNPPGPGTFYFDPPDLGYDALADQQKAAKTAEEFIAAGTKMFRYDYDNSRFMGLFRLKRFYATNKKVTQWHMGMLPNDMINLLNLVRR